jgi:hypothetical protein
MKQLFAGFSIARALAFLTLAMGCASSEQTEALLSDQALEPSSRPTRRSGHFTIQSDGHGAERGKLLRLCRPGSQPRCTLVANPSIKDIGKL